MKSEYRVPSSDQIHELYCVHYEPDEVPKAVMVLVHGMTEHIGRYEEFAEYLNAHGYAVVGYDQLGHGKTALNKEELGFFAKKKGYEIVIKDIQRIVKVAKQLYPGIPVVLFGHSMGSFFSRRYYTICGDEVQGAIFCGTGANPLPLLGAGLVLSNLIGLIRGRRYRSALLNELVFGSNNKTMAEGETGLEWLTKDPEKIAANLNDPFCGFAFTVGAYADFFRIMFDLERKKGYNRMPKDQPVLLIAGGQDPVGHQGEDVAALYDTFRNLGMEQTTLILCEDDRHEILNETDRQQVFAQIVGWLDGCAGE